MAKNQILIVVLVALVVSVVASVVTVNITGNVISVAKLFAGKVYTTAEVDSKLDSLKEYIEKDISMPFCQKEVTINEAEPMHDVILTGHMQILELNGVSDATSATLTVNNMTQKVVAGAIYEFPGNDAGMPLVKVFVREISYSSKSKVNLIISNCI